MGRTTTQVQIGETDYTVSLLKVGDVRTCGADIATVTTMQPGDVPSGEQIAAMATIVHAAVSHHREIPLADFQTAIDDLDYDTGLKQLADAFRIVMNRSGFEQSAGAGPLVDRASPSASPSSTG